MTDERDYLPDGSETGEVATWLLATERPLDDPDVTDRGLRLVDATFLGVGTTRHPRHAEHRGEFVGRTGRCGRCRWFETRIFRLGSNDYVLHHTGRSVVPGEVNFHHHERAYSPYEVIELYTHRRGAADVRLTRPAARALAQAAAFDADLREAFEGRAVI